MKKIFISILIIILCSCYTFPAAAVKPYQNYIYDHNKRQQEEPQAVLPDVIITGAILNISDFNSPQDVFVAKDGKIYIADTGNNRIIILNSNFKFLKEIKSFINNGNNDAFNAPTGLFITNDNELYIADSKNGRVVVLDNNEKLIKIYGKPNTPLISPNFTYTPLKIAVDTAKRLSIVADNEEKGIIQLEKDGSFIGFYGAIPTPPDLYNMIIRLIGTKEMKQSMVLNISTVYSNIDIDTSNFLYGTVGRVDISKYDVSAMVVHKLNPMGTDILKRFGNMPVYGDGKYMDYSTWPWVQMAPYMADIATADDGSVYSIIDQRTGHIYTYDYDGRLLFTFGINGSDSEVRMGQFGLPVAIDYLNNDGYIVVDGKYNQLVVFKQTEYGKMLSKLASGFYNHNYTNVDTYWKTALKYTSKSELLYNDIGQYYYKQANYVNAMKYFKLAENRPKFADAFQYFRKDFMSRYFGIIISIIIALIVLTIMANILVKRYFKGGRRA